MTYRKYESRDISAIRDILENDLGYNCELNELNNRINEMIKRVIIRFLLPVIAIMLLVS